MAVKKVFTPVGVTFRGDGFYKTDSRAKSSKSKSEPKKRRARRTTTLVGVELGRVDSRDKPKSESKKADPRSRPTP